MASAERDWVERPGEIVALGGCGEDEPDFAVQLREDLSESDMRHVLSVFSSDLTRLVAQIEAAVEMGQLVALRQAAHALAGAAGAVGAGRLGAACRTAMRDGSADAAALAAHGAAVRSACRVTQTALQRVLGRPDDPIAG